MSILREIFDGWSNYIFPSPEVEKIAKKRMAICVSCPFDKFTEKKTCTACGCYMPAKVRSPRSFCPEKMWEAVDIEEKTENIANPDNKIENS